MLSRSQKMSDSLEKIQFVVFTMFFHCFNPIYAQKQIAPVALRSVALYKRATVSVSDSLPLQLKRSKIGIHSLENNE